MTLAFQSARREATGDPVVFTLDGETFTLAPSLPGMVLLDLAAAAEADASSAAGVRALLSFLETALVDHAEWQRFRALTIRNRTDAETLLEVVKGVMPALVGRPTERPSASAAGPSATGPTSRVVSFSRGTVEEVPLDPETVQAASSG